MDLVVNGSAMNSGSASTISPRPDDDAAFSSWSSNDLTKGASTTDA